jgi:hypothetical protein
MTEPESAVLGGGGMTDPESAVLGGGGISDPESAVRGHGGMTEPESAVLGGGGITEGSSVMLRARPSSNQGSTAPAPNSITPCSVFSRRYGTVTADNP